MWSKHGCPWPAVHNWIPLDYCNLLVFSQVNVTSRIANFCSRTLFIFCSGSSEVTCSANCDQRHNIYHFPHKQRHTHTFCCSIWHSPGAKKKPPSRPSKIFLMKLIIMGLFPFNFELSFFPNGGRDQVSRGDLSTLQTPLYSALPPTFLPIFWVQPRYLWCQVTKKPRAYIWLFHFRQRPPVFISVKVHAFCISLCK